MSFVARDLAAFLIQIRFSKSSDRQNDKNDYRLGKDQACLGNFGANIHIARKCNAELTETEELGHEMARE